MEKEVIFVLVSKRELCAAATGLLTADRRPTAVAQTQSLRIVAEKAEKVSDPNYNQERDGLEELMAGLVHITMKLTVMHQCAQRSY